MLVCLDTFICLLRCKVATKCWHECFGTICCATADAEELHGCKDAGWHCKPRQAYMRYDFIREHVNVY